MKTVEITFEEILSHRITVNVPDDFDSDNYNMGDALADYDGWEGTNREVVEVRDVSYQPGVEELDLNGF